MVITPLVFATLGVVLYGDEITNMAEKLDSHRQLARSIILAMPETALFGDMSPEELHTLVVLSLGERGLGMYELHAELLEERRPASLRQLARRAFAMGSLQGATAETLS